MNRTYIIAFFLLASAAISLAADTTCVNNSPVDFKITNVITPNNDGFNDEFKVDLISATKGWLPNQTIKIRETTALSSSEIFLEGVVLWPNPAKNVFTIQLPNSDTKKVSIGLFDLQGRQILKSFEASKTNTFTKEINVENIAAGMYLLTIQQGNKKATKKIMVSK